MLSDLKGEANIQNVALASFVVLLDLNIFLSFPFSYTCDVFSSLKGTDQVSHTYKRTGEIIASYTLIFH
jgi:hypothetical protein